MAWTSNPSNIICVDNGSYEIKHSTGELNSKINLLHNSKFIDKSFNQEKEMFFDNIKSQQNLYSSVCKNYMRPLSRGLLSDVDLEIEIWENMLKSYGKISSSESLFMFSYPPVCPDKVLEGYFQIIFEYFGFDSLFKAIPHYYTAINACRQHEKINKSVQLVIDSGFSSTTIVALLNSRPIHHSIRRINVSGKLLTNYLKEALGNQTDLDLRKDFYTVNLLKEETCFVSKCFKQDMKNKNKEKKVFLLPDYRKKKEEDLIKLPKDRYSVTVDALRFIIPEILFNPNLIGIAEGGIHDGITQCIDSCHDDFKNLLYENIVLTGGNFNFSNFTERLSFELIPNSDYDSNIKIWNMMSNSYSDSVIKGMKFLSQTPEVISENAIRKGEYSEIGFNVIWKSSL